VIGIFDRHKVLKLLAYRRRAGRLWYCRPTDRWVFWRKLSAWRCDL